MPHEPKRRHSIGRKGKRRASITLSVKAAIVCPNCGATTLPHRICATCGFYKGTQVIAKKQKSVSTK